MRHALYFAPPIHHPLWAIGNAWLGRNPETGETVSQPTPPDFTAEEIRDATASPRRYGLHATLKAPFRLAAGCDETGLRRRLTRFAAAHASFVLTPLEVAVIDDFIALKTKDPSAQLRVLADAATLCGRGEIGRARVVQQQEGADVLAQGVVGKQRAYRKTVADPVGTGAGVDADEFSWCTSKVPTP